MPETNIKISLNGQEFKNESEKVGKGLGKLKGGLLAVGKAAAAAFAAVSAGVALSLKAFADFETGLVGVAKTTGLTEKEVSALGKTFQQLSKTIPVSTAELLEVAQTAGQLGVTGSKNIENFSVTLAKLGRASDLQGEAAAASIARILTVTGDGIETVDQFASVIVRLGNNFAATESEITRVATRVAQTTAVFDIGATNVAGISTALKALGVNAEIGGSAVGRAFQAIDASIRTGGKSLESLSAITGQTGEQLQKAFAEDATQVFELLIKGLDRVRKQGGSVAEALGTVGLKGIGVNQVFGALSKGSGTLTDALRQAREESENSTALNEEFAKATDTLASRFRVFLNTIVVVAQEIGARLAPAATIVIDKIRDIIDGVAGSDEVGDFFDSIAESASEVADFVSKIDLNDVLFVLRELGGVAKTSFKLFKDGLDLVLLPIELLDDGFKELGTDFKTVIKSIIEVAKLAAKSLGDTFGSVGTLLRGVFTFDLELIKSSFTDLKDALATNVVEAIDEIKGINEEERENDPDGEGRNPAEQTLLPSKEKTAQVFSDVNEIIIESLGESLEMQKEFLQAQKAVDKEKEKQQKKTNQTFLKEQIKFGTAFATINKVINSEQVQGAKSASGELVALQQSDNKTLKRIGQAAAVTQITIKTAESAMNIYRGFSTIPFIGPALGIAGAAAAIAFGGEQIGKVLSAQTGGVVPGVGGRGDTQRALLEPGELIVPRQSFDEVIDAVSNARATDGGDTDALLEAGGPQGTIMIDFESEEASRIITAQETEDTALGISRREA